MHRRHARCAQLVLARFPFGIPLYGCMFVSVFFWLSCGMLSHDVRWNYGPRQGIGAVCRRFCNSASAPLTTSTNTLHSLLDALAERRVFELRDC